MRLEKADPSTDKGWYAGPWNSDLPVSVGYANKGIDEPHVHARITEIYLVARGTRLYFFCPWGQCKRRGFVL